MKKLLITEQEKRRILEIHYKKSNNRFVNEITTTSPEFNIAPPLTPDQEAWLDKCTKSTPTNRNWSYNNGLVDVEGDFGCMGQVLRDFMGVSFGVVTGDFDCRHNYLTSLEGAPKHVGGDFNCSRNNLKSLEGAPTMVGRDFNCSANYLTSLKGAPQIVGEDFYCWKNQLTSLEGAPRKVGGDFGCDHNQLTSLEGTPHHVPGNFSCEYNQLTSLEGAPKTVGEWFTCFNNSKQFTEADVKAVTKVSNPTMLMLKQ